MRKEHVMHSDVWPWHVIHSKFTIPHHTTIVVVLVCKQMGFIKGSPIFHTISKCCKTCLSIHHKQRPGKGINIINLTLISPIIYHSKSFNILWKSILHGMSQLSRFGNSFENCLFIIKINLWHANTMNPLIIVACNFVCKKKCYSHKPRLKT